MGVRGPGEIGPRRRYSRAGGVISRGKHFDLMLTICYLVFQIVDCRADTRCRAEEFVVGGDW